VHLHANRITRMSIVVEALFFAVLIPFAVLYVYLVEMSLKDMRRSGD
jgi:hypothetical protein